MSAPAGYVPTVYRSMPTVRRLDGGQIFEVTGTPPILLARILWLSDGHWGFRMLGPIREPQRGFSARVDALRHASERVGTLTGLIWREQMTPLQRIMIGRDRACPYELEPAVHCGQVPRVGSVWCDMHPWGRL